MANRRRKPARTYIKKAAVVGGAAATATAMAVGMAAPSANAAATGPDYTQLITDYSDSLDNLLVTYGNVGGAAANIWDPIASAIPGGLLPTFTAGTSSLSLTDLLDIIPLLTTALSDATNLSGVPGLPANASTTILEGLLDGLGLGGAAGALPNLTSLVSALGGQLGTLNSVLAALDALNSNPIVDGLLGGIPTLSDLLGVTATQTTFNSAYSWPLLGLGSLLGLEGSTTISNTFAQLPSLNATTLTNNILDSLTVGGLPITDPLVDPAVVALVDEALAPLDVINTPSITAWIPAGSGVYGLPLGGSIGWLSSMPTIDLGAIDLPGLLSTTDTVLAVPLNAAGVVLPLNLASFATVGTPGIVLPTATGVSTLGGTSLTSFAIPMLGFSATNVNLLSAIYMGTNGINYNNGENLLTLITPLGTLPLEYSLGSFNVGTTGYGFTLPSLFGVGLLPSFQIGTAPTQQSPDGLLPAAVLNLGLAVPTQTTDLVTLLGLPNPNTALESLLNPVFAVLVAPVGTQITNGLNSSIGPLANGLASGFEQFTALLAQLSGGIATAGGAIPFATPLATPAATPLASPAKITAQTITPSTTGTTQNAPNKGTQTNGPTTIPKQGPLLNILTGNSNTGSSNKGNSNTANGTGGTQLSGVVNSLLHPLKNPVGGHSKGK
jgi:hypothetical protein